jgi:hypothetical protein
MIPHLYYTRINCVILYQIGGLAFDHWKLVVNVTSEGQGLQTIIFDMTEKFKKLTTIYSHTERNYWAAVVLPPNGSILIKASRYIFFTLKKVAFFFLYYHKW